MKTEILEQLKQIEKVLQQATTKNGTTAKIECSTKETIQANEAIKEIKKILLIKNKMTNYKGLLPEFKKAVIDWLFENQNEFQIINSCIEHFRMYIYDSNGNYLIGGEIRANFIRDAIKLVIE